MAVRRALVLIDGDAKELPVGDTLAGATGGGVDTANSPNANEFARFTDADTIEGRTVAETKTDLSLNNVDNTSDASKPVSTATQTALDLKAPLANPALTGTPTVPTAGSGTNTTQAASTAFVQAELALAVAGLLEFKSDQDCSANPNYPAASKGDTYYVTVAGKIGGASGKSVDVGDAFIAKADNAGGTEAAVGTSWFVLEHNLAGALLSANNLSDVANAGTARTNLGLGNVDNTSDASKPVSTAQQAALDNKQPLDADLTAIAALATTAYGRSLLEAANAAALQVLIAAWAYGNFKLNDNDDGQSVIVRIAENLTANRILNIIMGDATRTLTFDGNATIGDAYTLAQIRNAREY